ncbi:unnamed protein product [Porites lobata]|uniref:Protein XRP2 n=1 Tax=Porites lobata TaxID=104759 RepID=A0ABN8QP91_9CNID|nr:unnamed protein product [Porites lobata]
MGCLGSKEDKDSNGEKTEEKPTYSWDKRAKLDPKDYSISNVTGETVGKLPGEINGQQFIIQNCQGCNIFILDHTDSVTIDDCINCRIVLGPCGGSVFFRDCKDCKVVVACQQFRTRDCKKMDFFLCCATQPIIESSSGMKFACYQYFYPELEGQFDAARLSIFNNNWSKLYDFTPAAGETTWSLLPEPSAATTSMHCVHHVNFVLCVRPFLSKASGRSSKMADNRFLSWKEDHLKGAMPMYVKQGLKREEAIDFVRARLALISAGVSKLSTNVCAISEFVTRTWGVIRDTSARVEDHIPLPDTEKFSNVQIKSDEHFSVIPKTLGTRRKPFDESCLVVFFHKDNVRKIIKQLLHEQTQRSCVLVQTKEITMKPEDVSRIFQSEDYSAAAQQGPAIGLEFNSSDCVRITTEAVRSLCGDSLSSIYVSPNPMKASQDIDAFYNFVDMSMT